jgi:hypothetical protein
MVTEAMIEEIALPIHAMFPGHILFPVLNRGCHSRLAWKGKDGVQMIRHQKAQPAMPRTFLVVVFHRCEDGIADDGTTQLILAPGHTINGDEKPTAIGDRLRNCVWQLFANGKIQRPKCPEIANSTKYKIQAPRPTPKTAARIW